MDPGSFDLVHPHTHPLEYGFEAFAYLSVDHRYYLNGWKVLVLSVCIFSGVATQLTSYEKSLPGHHDSRSKIKFEIPFGCGKHGRTLQKPFSIFWICWNWHHCTTRNNLFFVNKSYTLLKYEWIRQAYLAILTKARNRNWCHTAV